MRRNLRIGIGIGAAAAAAMTVSMAAGVASAASGWHQVAASTAAVASVNKHITKAQAGQIAKARVPHSRVIEIESDDRNDRAVWKVTLATPHGRVIVDVDKRTGKATIVRGGSGGGHAQAAGASVLRLNSAASDERAGQEHSREARDRDDAREDSGDRGDRHDHDRDDAPGR